MSIAEELLRIARGEIRDDEWSRKVYSVDASHYEITPAVVAYPTDYNDVIQICEYSSKKKIPITPRGAGTGLLGQSLSDGGIIIDFTRHMNRIIEIEDDYVVVQPGIVKAVLDKELKKKNKFLPPDPASSNYCTVGGMIADNSSGIHCLGYGNTIDFLEELDIVYPDGNIGFASADRFDDRLERLCKLLQPYSDAIRKGYPKVSKNSCGYRLDAVITGNKFQPHKVFAASEGTLGIVTSAKMRILDIPEHRSILVLAFKNLVDAVSAVPAILKKFSPAALEMLDHTVVSHGGKMHNNYSGAGCLLFVEFARTDSSSRNVDEDQMSHCRQELAGRCSVVEYASDEESITRIWSARKAALNNVMKITVGSRKPMGLIEDTVVDPVFLPDHVTEILRAYKENNLDYVVYGHVGDGNLHTRPIIDFSSKSQIEMMERIAADVFTRVIKVGGTITGEHGDGIARVKYIEMVYGRELCCLFADVKRLFDPNFTINPGKKVLVR